MEAADVTTSTVRILIGHDTRARHHMAISIGETSDEDLMGFVKMSDITVPLTSILVEEQMFLDMGEDETLEVETWPEFAPEPDLLFHSNNLAVVMVDSEGSIRTGKAGTAVVTVSTADGVHEVKCTVYVDVPSGTPWEDAAQNEEDVPGAEESGAKGNLKKKKNKFNFQANGYTDKSVRFYKNYWYRLVVVKKMGRPGDHWFHHHPGGTISKIYMPFENQLSDNENPGKRSMGDYSYIAAHEMGHMMGLKDAYSDSKPKGKSWCGQQAYKTHDNGKILISDCILNRVDNYDDTRR